MTPSSSDIRSRHRDYFLQLVERAGPQIVWWSASTRGDQDWLTRLDADAGNIRSALRFSLDSGDIDEALRLAAAAAPYWMARRQLTEARQWLEEGLTDSEAGAPATRAKAHSALGLVLEWGGEFGEAADHQRRAVELARQSGDQALLCKTLRAFGTVLSWHRSRAETEPPLAEAVEVARGIGGEELARSLISLGAGLSYFASPDAWSPLEEGLFALRALDDASLFVELADQWRIAARNIGQLGDAVAVAEEALHAARSAGDVGSVAYFALTCARLEVADLSLEHVRSLIDEAEAAGRASDQAELVAECQVFRASLALVDGDLAAAAEQFSVGLELATGVDRGLMFGHWVAGSAIVGLAEAARHRGDTAVARGRLEEALRSQAMWRVPLAGGILARLSELAELTGDVPEAIRRTEEAIASMELWHDERAQYGRCRMRARALRLQGDLDAAAALLQERLAAEPDDVDNALLHGDLAQIHLRRGDGASAVHQLRPVVEAYDRGAEGPLRLVARVRLAQAFLLEGDYDGSTRALAPVLRRWRLVFLPYHFIRFTDPVIESEIAEAAASAAHGAGAEELAAALVAGADARRAQLESPRTWQTVPPVAAADPMTLDDALSRLP